MNINNQIDYFIKEKNTYNLITFANNNACIILLMARILEHPECTEHKKQIIFNALCKKGYNALSFLQYYHRLATEEFIENTVQAIIRDNTSLIGAMDSDFFNKEQKIRILIEICKSKSDLMTFLLAEMLHNDIRKEIIKVTLDNNILASALYIYEHKYEFKMRVYEFNKIEQLAVMAKLANL